MFYECGKACEKPLFANRKVQRRHILWNLIILWANVSKALDSNLNFKPSCNIYSRRRRLKYQVAQHDIIVGEV